MNAEANTLTVEQRKAEWLAVRRAHLTATDMAAILGLSKYGSRMGVWLDKRGLSETQENERMEWGNRLQAAILMGYADRVGHPIEMADPFSFIEVPDFPILGASLDARWADDDRRPVDAKNVGFKNPQHWGDEDTDQMPEHFLIQLTVQMMATGTDVADLAVLFGGNRLARYRAARDPEVVEMIQTAADDFWTTHIVGGVEPAIDGSKAWSEYLAKRLKQNTEAMALAGPEAEAAVRALAGARKAREEAEAKEAAAENVVKQYIGDGAGLVGEGWRVTWRTANGSTKVNWEGIAREIAGVVEMTDEELNAFVAANTNRGSGSRRFVPTFPKEE